MSFTGMASGPASGLRFSPSRGRIQGGSAQGVNYPSPFFDIAHTYYPVTVKHLFRWCRYYFLTNPLINATVFKLSEYPITDVIVDHESPDLKRRWSEMLLDHLRYRSFQVEVGLDFHVYGNAFVSVSFPFKKYLKCSCGYSEQASEIRQFWVFTNNNFRLNCPKCKTISEAEAKDVYIKNAAGIKLVRWNPEDIEVEYNDITGDYTYYYIVPTTIRNDIVAGKKTVVDKIPQIFIQSVREGKGVVFTQDSLFHMRRPTIATTDRGWGTPILLPVLKDTFYLQVMKKAQEAVLSESILPLRVLFPQPGSGSSDPYTTVSLVDWRDHVATEISRWRMDPNYYPILPLPIGNQTIGGDGKALLLTSEIQAWSEQIMVGMGVPREFLIGGMSYAGTNVSMRMLENAFIGYIQRHKALLRYIVRAVSSFLGWAEVSTRFKPFKMADDIQRKAYLFQLNQAQKISDTTLLTDADLSQDEENDIMLRESDKRIEAMKKQQLAMAEVQGESQLIMSQYQIKTQQAMQAAQAAPAAAGEPGVEGNQGPGQEQVPLPPDLQVGAPGGGTVEAQPPGGEEQPPPEMSSYLNAGQRMGGPGGGQTDLLASAQQWAAQLKQMDPQGQAAAIANIRATSPELADLVEQLLKQEQPIGPGVDMRPLPEQRSPRRQAAIV